MVLHQLVGELRASGLQIGFFSACIICDSTAQPHLQPATGLLCLPGQVLAEICCEKTKGLENLNLNSRR